jgi:hypothetical protein
MIFRVWYLKWFAQNKQLIELSNAQIIAQQESKFDQL